MTKLIVGNWKMYGAPDMAQGLARAVAIAASRAPQHVQVVLCPPALLVQQVAAQLQATPVTIGGQDCHNQLEGAHTGDTSAQALKSVGCSHVIVGHSERRASYGETDAQVNAKAAQALACGLIPIICIGETLAQRESGKAEEVVAAQVQACLPAGVAAGNFVLAYEPVWAIGSGKTPSIDDIARMHAHIIGVAAAKAKIDEKQVAVLYGGSVKPENAAAILSQGVVAGVLVGGASVKADEFCRIIEAA